MRRLVDLHTHSWISDGSLSPTELIRAAGRRSLVGVALTDHDSVAGLAEAAEAAEAIGSLTFVPGVEVSAVVQTGVLHILGLCIDPAGDGLRRLMADLRAARNERNPKMVAKLQAMDVAITMDEVLTEAGVTDAADGIVGRLHMAIVLVRKGYARDVPDAFARYLGAGAPAFVDKEHLGPGEAAEAIHAAGGLALIAHPVKLGFENFAQGERIIRSLLDQGLDGLEVYHSDHTDTLTRFFLDLTRRYDLAVSGGSDFHGAAKPTVALGRPAVPEAVMNDLFARAAARRSD